MSEPLYSDDRIASFSANMPSAWEAKRMFDALKRMRDDYEAQLHSQDVPVEVLSVIEVALEQYKERQLERNDKGRFALALDALAWLNSLTQD